MNICPNCKQSHDSTACPTPSGKGLARDDLFSAVDMTTETNVEMLRELNRSLELVCADAPMTISPEHESAKMAIIRSIKMFCAPMIMVNPSPNAHEQPPAHDHE